MKMRMTQKMEKWPTLRADLKGNAAIVANVVTRLTNVVAEVQVIRTKEIEEGRTMTREMTQGMRTAIIMEVDIVGIIIIGTRNVIIVTRWVMYREIVLRRSKTKRIIIKGIIIKEAKIIRKNQEAWP